MSVKDTPYGDMQVPVPEPWPSAVAGQGAWYSAVELTLAAGVNNIVFNPEDAQFPSTLDITAHEVVAVIGGLDYSTSDASNKVTFIHRLCMADGYAIYVTMPTVPVARLPDTNEGRETCHSTTLNSKVK